MNQPVDSAFHLADAKPFNWPRHNLLGHYGRPRLSPRFVLPRLTEALEDTPNVLIHGPRQCGKTTLAHAVGDAAGSAYISFRRRCGARAHSISGIYRKVLRLSAIEIIISLFIAT